jgi:hypothetical protein
MDGVHEEQEALDETFSSTSRGAPARGHSHALALAPPIR